MSEDQKAYLDWLNDGCISVDGFPGVGDAVRRLAPDEMSSVCDAHAIHYAVLPSCILPPQEET